MSTSTDSLQVFKSVLQHANSIQSLGHSLRDLQCLTLKPFSPSKIFHSPVVTIHHVEMITARIPPHPPNPQKENEGKSWNMIHIQLITTQSCDLLYKKHRLLHLTSL